MPAAPKDVCGLIQATAAPLERVPLRRREDRSFSSGWRLEVSAAQGTGTIVAVSLPDGTSCHRGEGMFLGWEQPRLAEVYAAMTASDDTSGPELELPQLG